MSNDRRDRGTEEIKPAAIRLTRGAESEDRSAPARPGRPRWIWALAILLVVAAGVVFFLPGVVKTPVLETATIETPAATGGAARAKSPQPEASPWQQAQEARQRSQSQEILSQLLKRQEELEDKNVEAWGMEPYQAALDRAAEGDTAYRERDFQRATAHYQSALDDMTGLLGRLQELFDAAMAGGGEALAAGDSGAAAAAFQRALLMKPGDEAAQAGLERARNLDEVLALITAGNDLQLNGRLEEARSRYQEALAIDGLAGEARRQIEVVDGKILDRDFHRLMSEGYERMQAGELDQAKSSFQQALKLKPGAGEAVSALEQAGNRMTNRQINTHLSRAVELEQQEQWAGAASEYDKALALDAALAQAQEGKRYAASRAALDERLESVLSDTKRLTNKAVYEETRQIYQQAVGIAAPGSRLARQLDALKGYMDRATTPVEVTFRSDNETEVTLNRVGILGRFEETRLTLLPGDYVAVGTREGYRDVRVQFTIKADQPPGQPVLVSAVEKIASR